MGTVPTPPTFTAGAVLTAADLNTVRDAINFLLAPPKCSVYQTTATTLTTSGTVYLIGFDTELYDAPQSGDSPMHDNTTNNSRVVARTSGKYEITGQVMFASNATGQRIAQVRLNAAGASGGGTQIAQTSQGAVAGGFSTSCPLATVEIQLSAGDYIEMFGTQTSGGSLNTNIGQPNTYLRLTFKGT